MAFDRATVRGPFRLKSASSRPSGGHHACLRKNWRFCPESTGCPPAHEVTVLTSCYPARLDGIPALAVSSPECVSRCSPPAGAVSPGHRAQGKARGLAATANRSSPWKHTLKELLHVHS